MDSELNFYCVNLLSKEANCIFTCHIKNIDYFLDALHGSGIYRIVIIVTLSTSGDEEQTISETSWIWKIWTSIFSKNEIVKILMMIVNDEKSATAQ